jgi:ubiquinone/menaquinone biosynthesis C-methylase UbiE
MGTRVNHPMFARMYARFSATAETKGGAEHRDELLHDLAGSVIEVGAGNGLNFGHYPLTVTEVVAVEPEAYLRRQAESAAQSVPVKITVVDGTADHLPVDDATFDAAVASLVLCSVADQGPALGELHRVIRPGGELRFYEHVLSGDPRLARVQRVLDRTTIWPRVGGGCHASRDTVAAIEAAGFVVESCRSFDFRPVRGIPTAPHVLGRARRPATTPP